MSIQAVTFYPIPPVRPVVRSDDQQAPATTAAPEAAPSPAPAPAQGSGRLLDIRV
ncbi:hypothetical protein [Phenylobacterium hankyongense]|uniref:hypothetical protein n=1 Tax=Phenylobacterium hankyongense TaxID=1813876 RepID=UPI0014029C0B|nr:hypothetical protein [Phenylobacterium hankyongense]